MKRFFILTSIILACAMTCFAQAIFGEKPKLVVGVVVDQMRWDYLSRYYDRLTDNGFKRLIANGYSFNNCLINYIPTVTAIGHTSIYTGTTPAFHGICGNNFYIDGRKTYCTQDDSVARESEYLSAGTLDLMYLAVRLAVCELALPEGEPCPLIIDDALVNLDNTRYEQAMSLLRKIALSRQVITSPSGISSPWATAPPPTASAASPPTAWASSTAEPSTTAKATR